MHVGDHIECEGFPCDGVVHERFTISPLEIDPGSIRCVMVAETPAMDLADDFYGPDDPFFLRTTRQAFAEAGAAVHSMADVTALGVYVTTAVKCAKATSAIPKDTIRHCAPLLEAELGLFPELRVIVAMGEVAIMAINEIGRRKTGERVMPAGPTYKLRRTAHFLQDVRVFPSYLQTGKSYLIEASKRRMIAEDLRMALTLAAP